jgi:hypothetical protein
VRALRARVNCAGWLTIFSNLGGGFDNSVLRLSFAQQKMPYRIWSHCSWRSQAASHCDSSRRRSPVAAGQIEEWPLTKVRQKKCFCFSRQKFVDLCEDIFTPLPRGHPCLCENTSPRKWYSWQPPTCSRRSGGGSNFMSH